MSTYQIAQHVDILNMVDMLRWRAHHQPKRLAFSFLHRAGTAQSRITYEELDHQARSIAAALQCEGAAGKPVLLLHPPGLEYIAAFYGCLYARAIAVPAYPPHSARTLPRIQAIVDDSQAKVILTTAEALVSTQRHLDTQSELKNLYWIATDTLDSQLANIWQEPPIYPDDLVFLQYTSGSTGVPRGVMVAYSHLMHQLATVSRNFKQTEASFSVSWLPFYHDLGLVCGILYPCYEGFPTAMMAPATFLQRPFLWLQQMSLHKATLTMAPNFAYDLCCRKITAEQRATLDLSHWEIAGNGGEPVRYDTLQRFIATFGPCGFRSEASFPGYGMAETTLMLTTARKLTPVAHLSISESELQQGRAVEVSPSERGAKTLIGYPQVAPNQRVIVVDPETRVPCPDGKVGEIWAEGPSVTRGYWHKLEETERTFHAYTGDTCEGPFLRTGDLGFLKEGVLFVTGRAKDLLIFRGCNYYPQDIELTVERSHPAIRAGCCAAFSIEADGQEQLVVLAEIDPRYRPVDLATHEGLSRQQLDPQQVIKAIRTAVSEEHDLPVYRLVLLKAGGILKTSSGKLQRRGCRAEFLAERLEVWNEE